MLTPTNVDTTQQVNALAGSFSKKMSTMFESVGSCLSGVVTPLNKFLVIVAALVTFIMAALIAVDIFLRFVFNSPIAGTLELEQYMLATVVFLTLGYAMMENQHVYIDLFCSHYSDRTRLVSKSIFALLSIYLFTIFSWQILMRAFEAIDYEEIGLVTGIPLAPFLIIAVFGCVLIALVLLVNTFTYLSELIKHHSHPWFWISLVIVISATGMALPYLLNVLSIDSSMAVAGALVMLLMMTVMLLGMPIAFAMGLAGFLGIWYLKGIDTALNIAKMSVFDSVSDYFFCVIPFFVLMGFLCFRAGLSKTLYKVGHKLFGQMPGGLAIGTIFGCAGFAAICGDSLATAGTMGSVAIPEMKKFEYEDALSTACVAAGGTLGILIPPSVGFIIYGLVAEQSIGKLFMAGITPGLLLAAMFSAIIYIRCKLNPTLGPVGPKVSISEKFKAMGAVWPMLILFIIVIGGIYMGLFTPTEGGGVGALGALAIGCLNRSLSLKELYRACLEAMSLTAMIFGILIGVSLLGYFIIITEIPLKLADFIVTLHVSRYVIFALILMLYVILGMVMNIIPMIMLTLPILFPTIMSLGFDPIWYGVIMVMMMEMGQITPPVGINVFVISAVAVDVPMATIFKGIAPFVLAMVLLIILLTIFPGIALFIPNSMETLPAIGG